MTGPVDVNSARADKSRIKPDALVLPWLKERPESKTADRIFLAVMVVGLALVIWTHGDFGVTWDERPHMEYGQAVADYFVSGGKIKSAAQPPGAGRGKLLSLPGESGYGPFIDLPAALTSRYFKLDLKQSYRVKHLLLGLIALAGVGLTGLLARRLAGPAAGAWAALFLILCPRYVGHGFVNAKDIPFAVTLTLAVLALAWALEKTARTARPPIIRLGLALGACLLTRQTGFVALALTLGAFFVLEIGLAVNRIRLVRGEQRPWERIAFGLVLAFMLAYGLVIALWPYIQTHPLSGPATIWKMISQRAPTIPALFDGQLVKGVTGVPWAYLPVWLAIGLPPVFLAGGLIGLAVFAGRWIDTAADWLKSLKYRTISPDQADDQVIYLAQWSILPAWVGGGIFYLILKSDQLYDGMRLFLFLLPGLAVLAGSAAARLVDWAGRIRKLTARLAALMVALALLEPAVALVRLHPLEAVYFSPIIGGAQTAQGYYDLDYWGGSTTLAARWLNDHADRPASGPVAVRTGDPFDGTFYGLGPGFRLLRYDRRPEIKADYYIGLRRLGMDHYFPKAPIVHRVERDGVTLAVVRRLGPDDRPPTKATGATE